SAAVPAIDGMTTAVGRVVPAIAQSATGEVVHLGAKVQSRVAFLRWIAEAADPVGRATRAMAAVKNRLLTKEAAFFMISGEGAVVAIYGMNDIMREEGTDAKMFTTPFFVDLGGG